MQITLTSEEISVLIEALYTARDKSLRYDEMEALLKRLKPWYKQPPVSTGSRNK